ncbi:hypothetical protein BV898_19377 [Hypsibius exemplaris]|uniref:Otopetrin-2 n=1 Tax=Hypsibius exemplaris TaxID=2072580 RepID=A0A9X6NLJ7_HYPEX|nr:hypothetical protein BV898_19377 [Hypsibius exemplaris]
MPASVDTTAVKPSRFEELREQRLGKLQKIRSASQYFEESDNDRYAPEDAENNNSVDYVIDLSVKTSLLLEKPQDGPSKLVRSAISPDPPSILELSKGNSLPRPQGQASNSSWRFLSVLYALVLIVLGTAFPLAEIISPQVQPLFYQKFYLFLYAVSLLFLIFAYLFLLEDRCQESRSTSVLLWVWNNCRWTRIRRPSIPEGSRNSQWECCHTSCYSAKTGSFFLRMGAILFGIGSMLYSCLEFGQYFELQESSDACGDVLAVVTPGFRFLFCFVQLYFIFTNFRIRTDRFTSLARFGLMHMMATNVCIWLSVLVEETKHELQGATMESQLFRPNGFLGSFIDVITNDSAESIAQVATTQSSQSGMFHNELRNSTYADASSCRSRTTVGNVLQQASPFLYPCIVEHSLICAALTYVMWSRLKRPEDDRNGMIASLPHRKRQQYTVDCHGATRGLFIGILMSLMTIISMTLFFVWIYIWHKDYLQPFRVPSLRSSRLSFTPPHSSPFLSPVVVSGP